MKPGLFRLRTADENTVEIECSPLFNDLFHSRPGAIQDHDTHRWIVSGDIADIRAWLHRLGHNTVTITTPQQPPQPQHTRHRPPPIDPAEQEKINAFWAPIIKRVRYITATQGHDAAQAWLDEIGVPQWPDPDDPAAREQSRQYRLQRENP